MVLIIVRLGFLSLVIPFSKDSHRQTKRDIPGLILNLLKVAVKTAEHTGASKEHKQPGLIFSGGKSGKWLSFPGS